MNSSEVISLFWGKAGRQEPFEVHPALYHMLDVGMVARVLVERMAACQQAAWGELFSATPASIPAAVGFVVALHDLGKISPGFQSKVPALQPPKDGGWGYLTVSETDHSLVTQAHLQSRAGAGKVRTIPRAIGAHHGHFHPVLHKSDLLKTARWGAGRWEEARDAATQLLAEQFGVDAAVLRDGELPTGLAMRLAGLTTLADWLGSDEVSFPRAGSNPPPLRTYAQSCYRAANRAVDRIHWGKWQPDSRVASFSELFAGIGSCGEVIPNSLQEAAGRVATQLNHPSLVIIEAPMGVGKTEAALWLADRLISRLKHTGLYIALPTQATSDQMFGRFLRYLSQRWPGQSVDVHLLHGSSGFNDAYDGLPWKAGGPSPSGLDDVDHGEQSNAAQIIASSWFRGHKRGLLAPFAVGTVDQALLAVLQTRHMFLRAFGLANKVVIIDEAHAYDTYTTTLMTRLVSWLRELGSTVIILSATLPADKRADLVRAYGAEPGGCSGADYPRITVCEPSGLQGAETVSLPSPSPLVCRRWDGGVNTLVAEVAERLDGHGTAIWFCNTVASAQQTYLRLDARPDFRGRVHLLHAQFPAHRRRTLQQEIEQSLGKSRLGPRTDVEIWVCTQVAEQSLDISADLMVTELAPIDLMLQRSGRLQRHAREGRPRGVEARQLFWLAPNQVDGIPTFGSDGWVYDPLILLRTAVRLGEALVVSTAREIEGLVDDVYGNDTISMPSEWTEHIRKLKEKSTATEWNQYAQAETGALQDPLNSEDPFRCTRHLEEDEDGPPTDFQAKTRLGDPTVTLICAESIAGVVHLSETLPIDPTCIPTDRDLRRERERTLLLHSLKLQSHAWVRYFASQKPPAEWASSSVLRHCRLAVFEDGSLRAAPGQLRLDPLLGLVRHADVFEALDALIKTPEGPLPHQGGDG